MNPDDYRKLAAEQEKASNDVLTGLDLTTVEAKLMLGLVGRMNVAVYRCCADLMQALATVEAGTPENDRAKLMDRLRKASIRGDDKAVESIMAEIEKGLEKRAGESKGSGEAPG